jgi:post-segregation antitoxin (ccd killing protein)
MSQLEREHLQRPGQAHIGAFVPAELRQQLVERAKGNDESVSRLIRRALSNELKRTDERKPA